MHSHHREPTGLCIFRAPSKMWIVAVRGGEGLNAFYTWPEALSWASLYLRVERGS